MSESAQFTIGANVVCRDGACGELRRLIVDPIARTVTHLVVGATHRQHLGRLVPIDLVDTDSGEIHLRCTQAEFEALEEAEETQYLPGAPGQWSYAQDQLLSLPHFALGAGGIPHASESTVGTEGTMGVESPLGGMPAGEIVTTEPVTYEKVPIGEVEVHRGDHVFAADGQIGRVRGLVIDPSDRHVTHVLLEEGHLWGRKEVAIPISAVSGLDDGVHLNITKGDVQDLPPVDVEQPN